jgi:hypothetical protein
MLINTPINLQRFLESRGYAPQLSGNSVCISLGTASEPHLTAFTFLENELRVTCQVALLGELAEGHVAQLCLAALDANMQISPYAFALIGAAEEHVELEKCPLVLTDALLTEDLHEAEVAFSLERLIDALALSKDLLALQHAAH